MAEEEIIRGPFWHYPILNAILRFLQILKQRRAERFGSRRPTGSPTRTYSNIETYEVFEDKQGVIKVRVHRKAEKS